MIETPRIIKKYLDARKRLSQKPQTKAIGDLNSIVNGPVFESACNRIKSKKDSLISEFGRDKGLELLDDWILNGDLRVQKQIYKDNT